MLKLENLKKILPASVYEGLFNAVKLEVEKEAATEKLFVKLADGTGEITGKMEMGAPVKMKSSEGVEMDCKDGQYAVEGGKTITVTAGAISDIADTAAEPQGEMMTADKVQGLIQEALTAQETKFAAQLKAITDANSLQVDAVKKGFTAIAEGMEIMAELKAAPPEKKEDPRQKFSDQRQKGFQSLLQTITEIKKDNK